jgi:hypothetical protein
MEEKNMRVAVAVILSNVKLTNTFRRMKVQRFNLEKNGAQVTSLNKESIKEQIGSIQYNTFVNNPCFYINTEFDPSADRINDLSIVMTNIRGIIQTVFQSSWLIKDNSININFIISRSEDGYIAYNQSPVLYSNANGEYAFTELDRGELEQINSWLNLLLTNVIINKGNEPVIKNSADDTVIFTNCGKELPYFNSNRLQRALRFIGIARAESFLPAKITFYISALESLMSITNTELRMQVADRSSRIIGKNYDEKIRIVDIVSIAYSFRSNYIHGTASKVKLKFLKSIEELLDELDDILRTLVRLFLTDLNYVVDFNDEDFNKWIKELLYK